MKVYYDGMFDEVLVPDLALHGITEPVKRGTPIEVPDEIGENMLRQPENWKLASPSRAAKSPASA